MMENFEKKLTKRSDRTEKGIKVVSAGNPRTEEFHEKMKSYKKGGVEKARRGIEEELRKMEKSFVDREKEVRLKAELEELDAKTRKTEGVSSDAIIQDRGRGNIEELPDEAIGEVEELPDRAIKEVEQLPDDAVSEAKEETLEDKRRKLAEKYA